MRLRHVLFTCATLSAFMAPGDNAGATTPDPATTKTGGATTGMSKAEMAAARASVMRMLDQLDIPYQHFTLPNGLRVMVHTDRSIPIVSVGMWYDVGSKHEPAGRSGFAHLFEHLMFNGSENVPGDYLPRLTGIGAQVNGNTSPDRTNYYEVVPTQALDRALFMESDRMGHLLGGIGQATLDRQRGVVQNEKRNGAASPTAVIGDMRRAALYPKNHPYGHSVIGSMKDLNAASLDDVRAFFRAHYGPGNALVVLAGDVDFATARRLVTKYFGDIPPGPRNVRPNAAPVTLATTVSQATTAPVTAPMIVRAWPVPGADNREALTLDMVAATMAGAPDSPFQRHLVDERKLFQDVSVSNNTDAQAGILTISGTVTPGVDVAAAAAALDGELALFLKQGPSAEALTRTIVSDSYNTIRGLEALTARAGALGEQTLRYGNPEALKANLRFSAGLTPTQVTATARRWLERPRWELTVMPGPRVTQEDDAGIDGAVPAGRPAPTMAVAQAEEPAKIGKRGPLPDVGPPADPRFPAVEHARLANGIPVIFARWGRTPFTQISLMVDGGPLNEPVGQSGTLSMMYALLATGFAGMDEDRIRNRLSLSGSSLNSGATWTSGNILLETPDANLPATLSMMRQALTAPAFSPLVIDRMKRDERDARLGSRLDPDTLARQEMIPLLDAGSPYSRFELYDNGQAYQRITRNDVLAAWHRWLRPEHARMVIVSDKPLADLLPVLNRSLGTWQVVDTARPVPAVTYQPKPGKPKVVLIDLPDAVQASIIGGQWVPATDTDPAEALQLANSVLGAGFSSRLNMNLREGRHWTYGASANFDLRPYSSSYTVATTVQQDKAGPAIAEVMKELQGIVSDRPIKVEEFDRVKRGRLGSAVRLYSKGSDILLSLKDMQDHDRPDDYPAKAGARIRAVTLTDADAALRRQIDPSRWSWVIVGNASIIRPQLDGLRLPVRIVKATDVLPPL